MSERPIENVWDYPRPPSLEPTPHHIVVEFAGEIVAETRRPWRVLETSHPPTYYIPPEDFRSELLTRTDRRSLCEWKGAASYWTLSVGGRTAQDSVWAYPRPTPAFKPIEDYFALYPGRMDRCAVDGETVVAQPGDFYGGWITSNLRGPFKGGPGSMGW